MIQYWLHPVQIPAGHPNRHIHFPVDLTSWLKQVVNEVICVRGAFLVLRALNFAKGSGGLKKCFMLAFVIYLTCWADV